MAAVKTSPIRLREALLSGLEERADPGRAEPMRRYMKSSMPFLGVSSPERRDVVRDVLARHPLPDASSFRRAVVDVWRKARFREERYVAVDLLLHRRYRRLLDLDALPLIEEIVTTGAWWDFVDPVASHAVGHLLRAHPRTMRRVLLAWARSRDLWKRRTAILAQLGFKGDTDVELLYACIEPSLEHEDFFLRKGIGWALRQYAWSNPAEVRRRVAELGDRLSPLSRREATKNLRGARVAAARAPAGKSKQRTDTASRRTRSTRGRLA